MKGNRQKRRQKGQFFVEGVRSINQLRRRPDWRVDALLYSAERRRSGWARDVLSEIDTPVHLELTDSLMEKLSDKEEPSEILAVVRIPDRGASDLRLAGTGLLVVLDRASNPGNLGSILRSCDAFGVGGVVLTGHSVDPYDPVVIRASVGAFFSVPVVELAGRQELDAWLGELERAVPSLLILGTSAKATDPLSDCGLAGPAVLCFGNETMGLSAWLKTRCHRLAGIPMRGVATSLNLACAVTAVLYEADRQRAGSRATGRGMPNP